MVLNEINSLVVVQCTYTGVEISLWGDDRLVFTPHLKFLFIDKYGDHIISAHTKRSDYSKENGMSREIQNILLHIVPRNMPYNTSLT